MHALVLETQKGKLESFAAHGVFHEDLNKLFVDKQAKIIAQSKERIEKVIYSEVYGWRSPGLYLDLKTLKAIGRSDIKWCSNVVLPLWFRQVPYFDYGNKIEFPIASSLDYNLFALDFKTKEILRFWLKDLEKVQNRNLDEIFTVMIHPWIYAIDRKNMAILREFLQFVASLDYVVSSKCSKSVRIY